MRKNGKAPKRKGDLYEREVALFLSRLVFGDDDTVVRAPLSGGGEVNRGAGGSDLLGLPGLFVEAKRRERFDINGSLRQVELNARLRQTSEVPVVITRQNRELTGSSKVVLRLDDFAALYRDALAYRGHRVNHLIQESTDEEDEVDASERVVPMRGVAER